MTLSIFIFGFLFGGILQYAKLNRYNTISGLAMLKNLTVAKAILMAIGVGVILFAIESGLGFASFHVKPFLAVGIMGGGLIFGAGMAILGYCPGTLAISLGEGSLDALSGVIGGLIGGLVYTLIWPWVKEILGPDWGTLSLNSMLGQQPVFYFLLALIIGGLFIAASFGLHKKEKTKDRKWLVSGIGLALLNAVIMLKVVSDRPIGASTFYPYFSDGVAGTTTNGYFDKIQAPGHWEMIFLIGAFFSGLVLSLIRKEFKLVLIHENWKIYEGTSAFNRIGWSFIGGFILIIGARMAGGCTSGHILSGGMQLAISSLVFALFVAVGLLVTGRLFYKSHN